MLSKKNEDDKMGTETKKNGLDIPSFELSPTEKSLDGREMVGVKNITNVAHPLRGTTLVLEINKGQVVCVPPGKAIPVPATVYETIKANRDCHGNPEWQKVALSECDSAQVFQFSKQMAQESADKVDDNTLFNVDSLIKIDCLEEASGLLSSSNSILTLQEVMRRYNVMEDISVEKRQEIARACVKRIAILSKRDS